MNHFTEQLYQQACLDTFFDDFRLVREHDFQALPFPVTQTVISFGSEKNDRMYFLLGYDIVESADDKTIVTILSDEKNGSPYCERCAENICMKILELDTQKMIVSIAVDRCVYDPNALAYKTKLTFGLRMSAVHFGEE